MIGDFEPKDDLTFKRFQSANAIRCVEGFNHSLDGWSLLEWCGAMAGEVGEACNKAKKLKRFEMELKGNKPNETIAGLRNAMALEIGDAIVYGFLVLSAAGYDVEEIIKEVFNTKSDEIGSNVKV